MVASAAGDRAPRAACRKLGALLLVSGFDVKQQKLLPPRWFRWWRVAAADPPPPALLWFDLLPAALLVSPP